MKYALLVFFLAGCNNNSPWVCKKEGDKKETRKRICVEQYEKGPCKKWIDIPLAEICKDGRWEEIKQ